MAGEGKFGVNAESIYVRTPVDGDMPLLDWLGTVTGGTSWADIQGRPERFPPDEHTHAIGDVDGLSDALAGKADSGDLADALASKADTSTVSDLRSALDALTARVEALEPDAG